MAAKKSVADRIAERLFDAKPFECIRLAQKIRGHLHEQEWGGWGYDSVVKIITEELGKPKARKPVESKLELEFRECDTCRTKPEQSDGISLEEVNAAWERFRTGHILPAVLLTIGRHLAGCPSCWKALRAYMDKEGA